MRCRVRADHRAVLVPQVFRNHRNALPGLNVLEARGTVVGELELRGVEQMHRHEVVAAAAELRERVEDLARVLVEVGDHEQHAAPLELLGELAEDALNVAGAAAASRGRARAAR